jgi:hypothetical protein
MHKMINNITRLSVIIDVVYIGNRIYMTLGFLTTNKYDSLTDLHAPRITIASVHVKSPQSSLAVAWQRLPTAKVPVPVGLRTVPGLSYELLASDSRNFQLTHLGVKRRVRIPPL